MSEPWEVGDVLTRRAIYVHLGARVYEAWVEQGRPEAETVLSGYQRYPITNTTNNDLLQRMDKLHRDREEQEL